MTKRVGNKNEAQHRSKQEKKEIKKSNIEYNRVPSVVMWSDRK